MTMHSHICLAVFIQQLSAAIKTIFASCMQTTGSWLQIDTVNACMLLQRVRLMQSLTRFGVCLRLGPGLTFRDSECITGC